MGCQSFTPTEAGHSSNQGPLGNTGTPRSGAIVLVTVNRGHSPPDLVRRQLGIELRHAFPFSPDGRASQISTQGEGVGGQSQTWGRFAVGLTSTHRTRKEGIIAGTGKTTQAKRDREKSRQQKQREKEERRVQRKAAKLNRPTQEGEDPDLAGLHWGPQPPLY